jgi:hypothetical protein
VGEAQGRMMDAGQSFKITSWSCFHRSGESTALSVSKVFFQQSFKDSNLIQLSEAAFIAGPK